MLSDSTHFMWTFNIQFNIQINVESLIGYLAKDTNVS